MTKGHWIAEYSDLDRIFSSLLVSSLLDCVGDRQRGRGKGFRLIPVLLSLGFLSGCQSNSTPIAPPPLHQKWELQSGQEIAGYRIVSGLGDLSIALKGQAIYAPFAGKTVIDTQNCLYFETPEVPNYKLRFCDVQQPHLGDVKRGDRIANADLLQFATLRKHPSGKWAIVEPSKQILESLLTRS